MKIIIFLSLLFAFFSFSFSAQAEPWMATRFAQNCAGCHAPSRYNTPPKDRRCTLSCQGCHVNPNGGGLRSFYGKWNSDRWMRSMHWKKQGKDKEKPLPWFAQGYIKDKQAQEVFSAFAKLDDKTHKVKGKRVKPAKLHKFVTPKSGKSRRMLMKAINATENLRGKKKGLEETNTTGDFKKGNFAESYYERDNGDNNWDVNAKTRKMYESTIPADDPYHLKKREAVLTGLDFRYMGRQPIDTENKSAFWPMTLDLGVQIKPIISIADNFSLVVETRYMNGPTKNGKARSSLDFTTTGNGVVNRSTYLMIDDMFYNTFIMYGMYKPMFEHYTPDHTTLAQKMIYGGAAYKVLHKTFSIGLAPNVPFANFHFIQPMDNTSMNQDEGFIANLGARWVTLGASLIYSYRAIKDTAASNKETLAHSLSGGLMVNKFVLNAELLNIDRERSAGGLRDSGSVTTFEVRYKAWKELYIEGIIEASNIGVGLDPNVLAQMGEGTASQMSLGVRFFPIAGIDVSAHYRTTKETPEDETKEPYENTEGLLQAHFYF